MKGLSEAQRAVLNVLEGSGAIYIEADTRKGMRPREVARKVWPDDPGWRRRTAGRGASSFNGCLGGTMPLRAGRVLANLERKGLVIQTSFDIPEDWDRMKWYITSAGRQALSESSA